MKKVIDYDPQTGISHVLYHDESDGVSRYVAEQDTTNLVDWNRKLSNEAGKKFGEFTKVASIPMPLFMDLKKKGILDDARAFKRWLNDPDNRFFRTHEAHL